MMHILDLQLMEVNTQGSAPENNPCSAPSWVVCSKPSNASLILCSSCG